MSSSSHQTITLPAAAFRFSRAGGAPTPSPPLSAPSPFVGLPAPPLDRPRPNHPRPLSRSISALSSARSVANADSIAAVRSSCSLRCCSRRAESAQQLREGGENGIRKKRSASPAEKRGGVSARVDSTRGGCLRESGRAREIGGGGRARTHNPAMSMFAMPFFCLRNLPNTVSCSKDWPGVAIVASARPRPRECAQSIRGGENHSPRLECGSSGARARDSTKSSFHVGDDSFSTLEEMEFPPRRAHRLALYV